MKKVLLLHGLPVLLCLWYIGSYILQPFPANGIAAFVILISFGLALYQPVLGAIWAIFLTPLTLSLGRHLESFFKESAPSYLPYAEMILVSILLGWVVRVVLNRFEIKLFPVRPKEWTPVESIVCWIFALWAIIAVIGAIPALVRNFQTSPSIPWDLFLMKLAFVPVWGLADVFFPLTMALRVVLLFYFVYYAQLLILQETVQERFKQAFISSMSLVSIYAIVQFIAGIGYSKSGNPERYVQGTFHENESFATFCLVAFGILLITAIDHKPFFFKLIQYALCFVLLMGVILSNSRAVMLVAGFFLISLLVYAFWFQSSIIQSRWKEFSIVISLVLIAMILLPLVSNNTWKKLQRLATEYTILTEQIDNPAVIDRDDKREAAQREGSLSLFVRVKLWMSALKMFNDSWFSGMGSASYYRLTGFPRYRVMQQMENTHMFWLQFAAELGLVAVLVTFGIAALIVANLVAAVNVPWMIGLSLFFVCNIVGQSLLQNEILWLFGIIAALTLYGEIPGKITKIIPYPTVKRVGLICSGGLILFQSAVWAVSPVQSNELGIIQNKSDTYGYAFDDQGHRFLNVGSVYQEELFLSEPEQTIEFRVRAANYAVDESNPVKIQCLVVDEYNFIVASDLFEITSRDEITGLVLKVDSTLQPGRYTAVLSVDKVDWEGKLFKSDERQLVGFWYYGFRLRS